MSVENDNKYLYIIYIYYIDLPINLTTNLECCNCKIDIYFKICILINGTYLSQLTKVID